MWTFRPIPYAFLDRPVSVIGVVVLLCGCKKDQFGAPSIKTKPQSLEFRWAGTVAGAEESNHYSWYSSGTTTIKIYRSTSSYTYSCAASWIDIPKSYDELSIKANFNTQKDSKEATISLVTESNIRRERENTPVGEPAPVRPEFAQRIEEPRLQRQSAELCPGVQHRDTRIHQSPHYAN